MTEVPVKYMLLIHTTEADESRPDVLAEYLAFASSVAERGKLVDGNELADPATSTLVRVRDGERLVVDGPYSETKEHLGGYFVVDCDDLDEAIRLAEQIPGARYGTIEVRTLVDHSG